MKSRSRPCGSSAAGVRMRVLHGDCGNIDEKANWGYNGLGEESNVGLRFS